MKAEILKLLWGRFTSVIGIVDWVRVVAALVMIGSVWFAAHYVWVTRPHEFYLDGVTDGKEAARQLYQQQKEAENAAILDDLKIITDERGKILSMPDADPDALLDLMRGGKM